MLKVIKSISGYQYFVINEQSEIIGVYYREVSAKMHADSKNKKVKK